mmetsp:Transcript_42445/g.99654  ORF Transcript_42445/g.99654 Transcript_42445/m.99654 type:complete len:209 (-) Transcript_42445:1291-1917(-)
MMLPASHATSPSSAPTSPPSAPLSSGLHARFEPALQIPAQHRAFPRQQLDLFRRQCSGFLCAHRRVYVQPARQQRLVVGRKAQAVHMMVVCLPQRQLIARVGCHDGDLPFLCAPRRQRAVRAHAQTVDGRGDPGVFGDASALRVMVRCSLVTPPARSLPHRSAKEPQRSLGSVDRRLIRAHRRQRRSKLQVLLGILLRSLCPRELKPN